MILTLMRRVDISNVRSESMMVEGRYKAYAEEHL